MDLVAVQHVGSSQSRDRTRVPCIGRRNLIHCATREVLTAVLLDFILFINGTPLQHSWLENPMDGGTWKAAVHGVAEGRTQLSDFTFTFTFMHWRRKWQPTPAFLPGESQGRGSLVGCRLWGRTESDTTDVTQQQQQQHPSHHLMTVLAFELSQRLKVFILNNARNKRRLNLDKNIRLIKMLVARGYGATHTHAHMRSSKQWK